MTSSWKGFSKKAALVAVTLSFSLATVHLCHAQPGGPQLPDPGKTSISREQQQKIGYQAAVGVYKQMPVLPDNSPETQYVRQLGERLVASIPPENSWPYEFHVVAEKDINAFALPGGEMFVNIGTITGAANEAELSGVMAHEMSHVYMQHSAKQMHKAEMTQGLAGLAGAVLGASGSAVGALGQRGVEMGAGMIMLKYSRGDEAQADHVGAIILYRAGYNPQAMADFFKTIESQGGAGPQFLSDHPNPGNREAAIQKEIEAWPPIQYRAVDTPEFAKVRQHASGVKAYTAEEIAQGAKSGRWASLNRENGAVLKVPPGFAAPETTQASSGGKPAGPVSLNEIMPSPRFVLADLGPLKMMRPENWYIAAQEENQSLTIAPRAGVVSSGIGYGVVINGLSPKGQMTIDQVTDQIVRSFERSGDTQRIGRTTEFNVAGVQGRSVDLQSTSPFPDAQGQSQKERDRLVTIPRQDGSVIVLVFVAPESEFERLNPTFERMLQSVQ